MCKYVQACRGDRVKLNRTSDNVSESVRPKWHSASKITPIDVTVWKEYWIVQYRTLPFVI